MTKRRSFIRLAACAAAASLFFAQVALAAFMCSMPAPEMTQAMEADGCHGASPGAHHLCVKTCQDEPQKSEAPTFAALPPAADAGVRVLLQEPSGGQGAVFDALIVRATSPPRAILYSRFLK